MKLSRIELSREQNMPRHFDQYQSITGRAQRRLGYSEDNCQGILDLENCHGIGTFWSYQGKPFILLSGYESLTLSVGVISIFNSQITPEITERVKGSNEVYTYSFTVLEAPSLRGHMMRDRDIIHFGIFVDEEATKTLEKLDTFFNEECNFFGGSATVRVHCTKAT